MRTVTFNWAIIRRQPWPYIVYVLCNMLGILAPLAPGLIQKSIFDSLTGSSPSGLKVWTLLGLFVSVELARLMLSVGEEWGGATFRFLVGGLLRSNIMAGILRRPGAEPRAVPL
ncbi:MAG TPA: ABC transporter ATP-binding protein, partial [Anaerolineae bacterium]